VQLDPRASTRPCSPASDRFQHADLFVRYAGTRDRKTAPSRAPAGRRARSVARSGSGSKSEPVALSLAEGCFVFCAVASRPRRSRSGRAHQRSLVHVLDDFLRQRGSKEHRNWARCAQRSFAPKTALRAPPALIEIAPASRPLLGVVTAGRHHQRGGITAGTPGRGDLSGRRLAGPGCGAPVEFQPAFARRLLLADALRVIIGWT
jgi:hypothetical protein